MSSSASPISGADRAFIALAVLLGAVVLGTRLGWQDYWWDEYVTLMFTRSGWYELLVRQWGLDTHRPIYYALQKGWNAVFGESIEAVRALPVFLTLLTVPVFFRLARQIERGPMAGLVVLLLVSTPAFVYLGREIRMYCLLNLALSVALMLLVILADRARTDRARADKVSDGPRPGVALYWAGVAAALAVAFYAQAIAIFVSVLILGWILLAVLLRMLPVSFLWQALLAGALYTVLIVPALVPFFSHLGGTLGGSFWVPEPSLRFVYEQTAGVFAYPKWGKPLFAVLLLWGFWCLRRKPVIGLLLAILVIGLPLMVLLFSFLKPIYIGRVFAWSGFVAVPVLAYGLVCLGRGLRWAALSLLLIAQAVAALDFYPDAPERSLYAAFRGAFADFDAARDTLVLGNQIEEPALRWYAPQAFEGDAYGFIYADRNRNVIDAAFRSRFVPRAQAGDIRLSPGRLFVFHETEPRNPVAPEDQVTDALDTVTQGHRRIDQVNEGRFRLDIYRVE